MLPLYTDGRLIRDSLGRTINPVGGQHPMHHACAQYWKPEADPAPFAARMAELGVKIVRLSVHYGKWNDPALQLCYRMLIDNFVHELTSRNVYCVLGCMGHELIPELAAGNTTNWTNFLTELALRYANNPGMCGLYIQNEPPYVEIGGMDGWYELAAIGVNSIRSTNPRLLIIVHADIWNRQGFYERFFSEPLGPNVVLTYHYYYWMDYYYNKRDFTLEYEAGNYATAKALMEASLYTRFWGFADTYNKAIICDEFGFNGGQNPAGKGYGNEPGWPQCQIDYMNLLTKYGVPWIEYSWWVKTDENYGLALKSDYYTLSTVGEIWSRYLAPPTPIPPTILFMEVALGLTPVWATIVAVTAQEFKRLGVIP